MTSSVVSKIGLFLGQWEFLIESETDSDSEAEREPEALFEPSLSQREMVLFPPSLTDLAEPPCLTETSLPPCQTETHVPPHQTELPCLTGILVPCQRETAIPHHQTETAVLPHQTETAVIPCAVPFDTLEEVLKQGQYNWFVVVESLSTQSKPLCLRAV